MKKKNLYQMLFLLAIVISLTFQSCMTTKTSVGNYREADGEEYTYAKGKQLWVFWGLFPIGRTNVNTPGSGSCEVITRFNFGDVLITGLTAGIISSYTIKVKAKKKRIN
jgi:hypothetical protein